MNYSQQILLPLNKLESGMVVARTVISFSGKLLLEAGRILTPQSVRALSKWDIAAVEIVLSNDQRERQQKFKAMYNETLCAIRLAFEKLAMFKEVPIVTLSKLIEENIFFMVDVDEMLLFLQAVKVHNEYTFEHSLNVAIISGAIGKWLGYQEQLKDLILAGLLHDIGKVFVSRDILNKPGRLTSDEMSVVKTHSVEGYNLLSQLVDLSVAVKKGVLEHHERRDGSGYPLNLSGNEITIYAKIIAIADVYDALTTERSYRKSLTPFSALEIIIEEMYAKLDPAIASVFLEHVCSYLNGCLVILNTGEKAKVVLLNNEFPTKPIVQLENNRIVDLRYNNNIKIAALCEGN